MGIFSGLIGSGIFCRQIFGFVFIVAAGSRKNGKVDITASRIATGRGWGAVMAAVATACRLVLRFVAFFFQGMMRFERNDIDEKRDEHADQGVDHAVDGETGNAGVGAMRDRHAEKRNTGNIGQRVFPHELDKVFEGRDSERIFVFR